MSGTAYIPAHNIPGPAPENSIVYYQPAFVFAVDLYNYAKWVLRVCCAHVKWQQARDVIVVCAAVGMRISPHRATYCACHSC